MQPAERQHDLVTKLRTNGDAALASLRALDTDSLNAGRYENGWSARQILAHLAAIEWTYPRLLDLPPLDAADPRDAATPVRNNSGAVRSRMDDYNARQVEKRATATVAELIDEFARNRDATVAAIASADPSVLARTVESFGGMQGPLADVIEAVVLGHVQDHIRDIVSPVAT